MGLQFQLRQIAEAIRMKSKLRLEITLLVALFAIRMIVVIAPLEFLLRHTLTDDAFYYFVIARNVSRGLGSTFDGISPTNGYHPLWLVTILPIFALLKNPFGAIRATLCVAAVMDTITIVFIYLVSQRLGIHRWFALLACILYGLSPLIFLSSSGALNGLETGLNTLLVTMLGWTYLHLIKKPCTKAADHMPYGVLCALCFLARTDNAIMLAVFGAYALFHFRQRSNELRCLIAAFLLAGALIAPWLVYCGVQFGSIVQVSGQSIALVNKETLVQQGWTSFNYILQFLVNLLKGLSYSIGFLVPRQLPESLALALAVIPLSVLLLSRVKELSVRKYIGLVLARLERDRSTSFWFIAVVAVTYVIFIAAHTIRAVYPRPWYYASTVTLIIAAFAYVVDKLLAPFQAKGIARVSAAMLILILAIQGVTLHRLSSSNDPGELQKWAMVSEMNRVLPPQSVVGSWNAGLYGYFSEEGRIVNLDGVVNNVAYRYIRNHSLAEYAESVSMEYVVDDAYTLTHWERFWRDGQDGLKYELLPVTNKYDITLWKWEP